MGCLRPARALQGCPDRHPFGHLAVGRRLARRARGGLRSARRSLRHADRRRRSAPAHQRRGVGHAAALQPRWPLDRLHLRSRRRRQYLDRRSQRRQRETGDEGRFPAAQPGRLDPRQRLHRRAQAFHRHAVTGGRRNVALSPRRRRRRAADEEAHRSEGHQRTRLLARRALSLLFGRRDAGRHVRLFQGRQRRDLCDPAARSPDRQDREICLRPRRIDPANPVAGRQEPRLHPQGSVQVHALCA